MPIKGIKFIFLSFLVLFWSACSSTDKSQHVTSKDLALKDNGLGLQLAKDLETKLKVKQDTVSSDFLEKTAKHLAEKDEYLRVSDIRIILTEVTQKTWQTFGVPGIRIYLSIGLLKQLEYENEMAGAIAFELAHVKGRHLMRKFQSQDEEEIQSTSQIPKFSPEMFRYTDMEQVTAINEAVRLMYEGGYDPRGLSMVWNLYSKNITRSPYTMETLKKLTSETYGSIARFSPLRHPIIKSNEFTMVQERIRKLQ